jgi:dihydropteridine reductase
MTHRSSSRSFRAGASAAGNATRAAASAATAARRASALRASWFSTGRSNAGSSFVLCDDDDDTTTAKKKKKKALVLGSSGALGSQICRDLSLHGKYQVLGADTRPEIPGDLTGDWELDDFCDLSALASSSSSSSNKKNNTTTQLSALTTALTAAVLRFTDGSSGLDVIVCASGGWEGDPDPPVLRNTPDHTIEQDDSTASLILAGAGAYGDTIARMVDQNLNPVLAAGYVAHYCMAPHALMVVLGATVALQPTPTMLGYGTAKAGAHHVVQTIGACTEHSLAPRAVQQQGRAVRQYRPALDTLTVVGILPTILDTPANRRSHQKSGGHKQQQQDQTKFRTWTKPEHISREIGNWLEHPELRPHSGALVKVYTTEDGQAAFELAR